MLYTSQSLPLTKITLDDWQLVKVSGIDNTKFLQGQLTADINQLNETNFLFAAQCEPKGKTLSNMVLFKRGEDIYYIERKSVIEVQIKELKKYAIFSKVTIETDLTLKMVGIAASNIADHQIDFLSQINQQQNCTTINHLTFLKIDFPVTRYIVIGKESDLNTLQLGKDCLQQNSQQWELLDVEANYPIIDLPTSNQYLPQAFNLQNFSAISFDKGCYCGQEMVARAQYRGINKRALYLLTGQSDQLPQIGETLEQQMGENWRETGCVLTALKLDNDAILVQAILNNDLEDNAIFRVKNNPASKLYIKLTELINN